MHPLLPGWSSPPAECCGNWTPDGNYFVFQSDTVANTITLWAIREKSGFLRRRNPEPIQLTTGQEQHVQPGAEPGREEALCDSRSSPRRTGAVRCQVSAVLALSFRNIRDSIRLFERWAVGRLYEVTRTELCGAAKWTERSGFSSLSSPWMTGAASMVARWEADCIRCHYARQDPCTFISCRQMAESRREVTHGERDEIVPNWSRDGDSLFFGNFQIDLPKSRHLSAEFEDQPTHDLDRF